MRKLTCFEQVSLDGYFVDGNGDMSWAHKQDPEWNAFAAGNAKGGGALLMGRVTYEMMAGFWPTPAAAQSMPEVAEGMNRMPKYVASRTLRQATWSHSTILDGDLLAAVRRLKGEAGPDITILGSGSIVAQLAPEGLIDVLQVVVNPIVLGRGRTLFEGADRKLGLRLGSSRAFRNGNVVLEYEPAS